MSYLFWESPLRASVRKIINHNEILYSAETLVELTEVIMRAKFDHHLEHAERESFLTSFIDEGISVIVKDRITACRDPRDNKFLEVAVAGKADMILSGDADLLALDPFRGIRIVSPAEFSALS